jgi:hypothetical protein
MEIISHRGLWSDPHEKNTPAAFDRTIAEGFGTETDVRDFNRLLVVSHDPPGGSPLAFDDVLASFAGTGLPLAINVKADGLGDLLRRSFGDRAIDDWFAFDMSGPEMVRYARSGLPYFTRQSDVEPEPILYEEALGVWLDAFHSEWFDRDQILRHVDRGKKVCVVSPELHGRAHARMWEALAPLAELPDVMLCTDFPIEARRAFRA